MIGLQEISQPYAHHPAFVPSAGSQDSAPFFTPSPQESVGTVPLQLLLQEPIFPLFAPSSHCSPSFESIIPSPHQEIS